MGDVFLQCHRCCTHAVDTRNFTLSTANFSILLVLLVLGTYLMERPIRNEPQPMDRRRWSAVNPFNDHPGLLSAPMVMSMLHVGARPLHLASSTACVPGRLRMHCLARGRKQPKKGLLTASHVTRLHCLLIKHVASARAGLLAGYRPMRRVHNPGDNLP